MKIYSREVAIQRMNSLANQNKEFFFITSYDTKQAYIEELANIDNARLLFSFPDLSNASSANIQYKNDIEWKMIPPNRNAYNRSIEYVKSNIRAGNSYLTNLTCRMPIETNLTMYDIFQRSKALYKCWLSDRFVCFSPEIFVRVDGEIISSFPMKGTIDATITNAAEELMKNPKEAAEHATIVDLIRNDLSIVANRVQVERYRYIDRLETNHGAILQTSSEIRGHLAPPYLHNPGSMLFALLPAGSITGAPKRKTVQIISEAEDYERGFYTGVMGYYSHGRLDSAVMIRFIDQEDGKFFYKAGGGITARSDNEAEYQEVIEKVYVPIY